MSIFLRTVPHHLQEKVLTDTDIQIQLMIDVNASTVNEKTVVLFNMDSQKSEPVSLKYKTKMLSATPRSKLQPDTHYQVELLGGIEGVQDIYGNPLPQSYNFEFRTANAQGIKAPVILTPADLSQVEKSVSFSWSSVPEAYFYEIQISKSNIFDVIEWPGEGHRIHETSVTPDIAYQSITYFVRVRAVNSEGQKSAYSKVVRFVTSVPIDTVVVSSDTGSAKEIESLQQMLLDAPGLPGAALEVEEVQPKDKSVNMDLGFAPVVTVKFSELLDPNSVTIDSIYLAEEKN